MLLQRKNSVGNESFSSRQAATLAIVKNNLEQAKTILKKDFEFVAESRIYESPAVDYLNQPDFFNQVLEFKIPAISPEEVMKKLLSIEKDKWEEIRDNSQRAAY
jgi:7,8-dihydro-6-hydroxymethylpterin-pyrophosphokinase